MAYEIMARNCSEEKLNSGKIAATLTRAGQIIQRKSIDQREQTLVTEENPRPLSMVDPNRRTYTVATAAQIEANRRNAQKSTGPKTERGRAREGATPSHTA